MSLSFYKNKTVFVTGHTGFKGSWMCRILTLHGAKVVGYAQEPPTSPALFDILNIENEIVSIIGDVRDFPLLIDSISKFKPEIVIHMAAQPIVRDSYKNPVYTYETNIMGTVNILEAVRLSNCVKSFVNVTTDKVYRNNEWDWGYRENDMLDGYDPYSNSKSCSELVTASYNRAFFIDNKVAISTCRAGNVIGGGDFATDRIIPDCIRAAEKGEAINVRNPYSTRPYQHVLEPVFAYLMLAAKQYHDSTLSNCYNIGPNDCDCITTGDLVELFCNNWGNISWANKSEPIAPHEASFLKLDCSKMKKTFAWCPCWDIGTAMKKVIEWNKSDDKNGITNKQINEYSQLFETNVKL